MHHNVATILSLEGQAWAKSPDGTLRLLAVGDRLGREDVLVTGSGARVILKLVNGEQITIDGDQQFPLQNIDSGNANEQQVPNNPGTNLAATVLQDEETVIEPDSNSNTGQPLSEGSNVAMPLFTQALASPIELPSNTAVFSYDTGVSIVATGGSPSFTNTYTNQAPQVADQIIFGQEDSVMYGQIMAADIEGDVLQFAVVDAAAQGELSLDAFTGRFTYTPSANYHGTDHFVVEVTDSYGNKSIGKILLDIAAVNDSPVADNLQLVTDEDAAVQGQIVASDFDGDTLNYQVTVPPLRGSVTLDSATGQFVYTPHADVHGADSFSVTVNDGNGGTATSFVQIQINPVNDAPVAADQHLVTNEDNALNGQIDASDVDGDSLHFSIQAHPLHGSVSLDAVTGQFTYTPALNYHGSDAFVVIVSDGRGGETTSRIVLTVNAVNDAPVTSDQQLLTDENTALQGTIIATDVDGDQLVYSLASAPANGTLVLNATTGAFVYTPHTNYSGSDSFVVTVFDGKGGTTTSTISIGVNPVNDAPTATNQSLTTDEDTPLNGAIVASDVDGDTLTYSVTTTAANGTVTIDSATGQFTYTPNANYNGNDSFVVTVSDGKGGTTTSTISIGVTPVNDNPVANDDLAAVEQNGSVIVAVRNNDIDVDGDPLIVTGVTQGANGSVVIDAITGNPIYTPDSGFFGNDTFTYTISDGNGGTATGTVNVTVNQLANQTPETNAVSVSGDEDTLITIHLSGSDIDGSVTGFVIKSLPADGVLYLDTGRAIPAIVGDLVTEPVYFLPHPDWNGNTGFTYAARDNGGLEDSTPATVSITVNPMPDTAQISGDISGSVKEDIPAQTTSSGKLTVVDPDAGEAFFVPGTNIAGNYGSFSVDANGNWTYVLDNSKPNVQSLKEDETRLDTFTVASIDGTTEVVTITVRGTNDAPVANNDTASVNQDTTLTLTPAQLLVNDFDIDGDTLSITEVQSAINGTVTLVGGNVLFTPTAGYHGSASFTYTLSDGKVGTSTGTVNVAVIRSNTQPVAVDDIGISESTSNQGLYAEYYSYRQGTDGPNLSSLGQVKNFVLANLPTATFTATTLNYNADNAFNNNLGQGTNLQTFLGVDADSLSLDPGNSSDAIIRMQGFIELSAGNYNFRVLADDGYQILINGATVAQLGQNQAGGVATSHTSFEISTSGIQTIEILYWDQGYSAQFVAEISDNGGAAYSPFSSFNSYKNSNLIVTEDIPLAIPVNTLLANDTDADGDTLHVIDVSNAVNGTVALVGGNVTFTPVANYAGAASFSYTVSDGKGGFDSATVHLVVVPVNDAPIAINDFINAGSNHAAIIQASALLANDVDVDGDILTIVSVQNATNGTVNLSGTLITFNPLSGYEGPASFTYTVQDNNGVHSTATVNLAVGQASAPSVVVSKSLVAIAKGTGGTSVKFPITTKLVDTDGSETLSIKVSNVPTGLSFNAGVNLGGGVWQFTEADLPNLMLNLPGSYSNTSGVNLTVQVTSTEMYGGFTASTSTTVNLKAGYTSVDITTTESGSFTGSSASEFFQGGAGNNVIHGGNGNNIIYGGAGNDTLTTGSGSDIIYGGSGDDIINSGSGNDRIYGGAGNDIMRGGDAGENFVDVFVWELGDQGAAGAPAVDTIQFFSTAAAGNNGSGGDVLDLRDLLQGESVGPSNSAGNLADYLHFEVSGGNTIIHISHTGGFGADSHNIGGSFTSSAETQKIVLEGVNLQTNYAGATTDQQIITQLLNNNKLIVE